MKAQGASATAKLIAASTLLLDAEARDRGQEGTATADWCRRFLSTSARDRWLARSAVSRSTRWAWRSLERLTHPGIIEHYARRKAWIESRVRTAIVDGADRVIVLGAGFDTLALRLANEFPIVEWIEIDHPATQAVKIAAIRGVDQRLPSFLSLDLCTQAIPDSALGAGRGVVVIAEGLLMYLPSQALDQVFASLQAVSVPLELIFSCISRWPDGSSGFRPRSFLVERWLAHQQEPFTWAIAPEFVPAFLSARGFQLRELALTESFRADGSRLRGENLVRCGLHHSG